MFSDRASHAVDLSPVGRGRERSERVRGAAVEVSAIPIKECGEHRICRADDTNFTVALLLP